MPKATPPRFVWYTCLHQLGEHCLDLYSCRRFILAVYNTSPDPSYYSEQTVIFYHTNDHKWVEYRMEESHDEDGTAYPESYRECAPETVAYQFLYHKPYGANLPPELEKYRSFGDLTVYQEWVMGNPPPPRGRNTRPDSVPLWDKESRTVHFAGRLCKEFGKDAFQQEKILDAFETLGWPKRIDSPFLAKKYLKQTVDSMNKWENSPIEFRQDKRHVFWSIRRPKSSSADNR